MASCCKNMHEDFQRIKTLLMYNIFPAKFLDGCLRNFTQTIYKHQKLSFMKAKVYRKHKKISKRIVNRLI